MKNRIGVLIVLASIIAPGIVAKALSQACCGLPSVTISDVSQSGAGQPVGVSGSYSVPSGYTFGSISVYVMPTGGAGGTGGVGVASTDGSTVTASISVPAGGYDVQAVLTATDGCGNADFFYSSATTDFTVK